MNRESSDFGIVLLEGKDQEETHHWAWISDRVTRPPKVTRVLLFLSERKNIYFFIESYIFTRPCSKLEMFCPSVLQSFMAAGGRSRHEKGFPFFSNFSYFFSRPQMHGHPTQWLECVLSTHCLATWVVRWHHLLVIPCGVQIWCTGR